MDQIQFDRMSKGRSKLIERAFAIGAPALRLKLRENRAIVTARTDGTHLEYNPEWIAKQTVGAITFHWFHEVMHCFAPGTQILTDKGLQTIETIQPGAKVWAGGNHNFTTVKDTDTHQHDGEVVVIRPAFGPTVRVTPEHRFLTAEWPRTYNHGKTWEVPGPVKWREVGELDPDKHVLVFQLPDSQARNQLRSVGSSRAHYEKFPITFDEEMAELTGWFVAEGNLAKPTTQSETDWFGPSSKRYVCWTLGLNDPYERICDLIRTKLRRSPSVTNIAERHARRVSVSAKLYATFLAKHFYDGRDKTIPSWLLSQPDSIIRAFVKGYAAGDGHTDGDFTVTSSVAPGVSGMLALLLLRLRYRPSLRNVPQNTSDGAFPNARPAISVKWANRANTHYKRGDAIIGNKWFVPIRSVKREPYSGPVYNLATTTQTYSLPFATVHNCLMLHPWRIDWRDPKLANQAADYAINNSARDYGFELPDGILLDARFDGLGFEEIYAILAHEQEERQAEQQPQPQAGAENADDEGDDDEAADDDGDEDAGVEGDDEGDEPSESGDQEQGDESGDSYSTDANGEPQPDFVAAPVPGDTEDDDAKPSFDAEGVPGNASSMSADDWKQLAAQMVMLGRKAGTMPGDLQNALAQSREARVRWQDELREFIERTVPTHRSWSRPNRRMLGAYGIVLPGTVKENTPHIVLIADTSGSTQGFLQQFADEFVGLAQQVQPSRITFIACDAEIQSVTEFEPDDFDTMKFDTSGGGGTSMRPAFEWVDDQWDAPAAIICLTDLEIGFLKESEIPTMFVVPEHVHYDGPFGRTIRIPPAH